MDIKQMKEQDKPRERLIKYGSASLADHELLAIMLGCGTKELSVLDLAAYLIQEYGLNRLLRMSFQELKGIKGIKEAKATKLMSCFELARRCMKKEEDVQSLENSNAVYSYCKNEFLFLETEKFMAIYVDCKCKVLFKLFLGQDESFMVALPIRSIIKHAISYNAYGVFLIHNHPSGDVRPSRSDIEVTKRVEELLREIHIELLDHIIIGKETYFSFLDKKLLS